MSAAAIELAGVGKRYTKYDDTPLLASAALRLRTRTRRSALWALRGVDLRVQPGESLGVVGRNGAGKSTLLALLAGVTAPTTGTVRVRGRVAPLISVGVGFHPELTGRENVYVNGMILGMSRAQVDRRFDDIVDFSGLAAFVDTPVKFYSSGMFVRLGFAVAVQAEPDVLLIDEILAVGDMQFQLRCFDYLERMRRDGVTVVLVTHNLTAVRGLCSRAVLLHDGGLRHDGPPVDTIAAYHAAVGEDRDPDQRMVLGGERAVGGRVEVQGVELLDADGSPAAALPSGGSARLRLRLRTHAALAAPYVGVHVATESGIVVYSDTNRFQPFPPLPADTTATVEVALSLPLATGSYSVGASVHETDPDTDTVLTYGVSRHLLVYVSGRAMVTGVADLGATFRLADERAATST